MEESLFPRAAAGGIHPHWDPTKAHRCWGGLTTPWAPNRVAAAGGVPPPQLWCSGWSSCSSSAELCPQKMKTKEHNVSIDTGREMYLYMNMRKKNNVDTPVGLLGGSKDSIKLSRPILWHRGSDLHRRRPIGRTNRLAKKADFSQHIFHSCLSFFGHGPAGANGPTTASAVVSTLSYYNKRDAPGHPRNRVALGDTWPVGVPLGIHGTPWYPWGGALGTHGPQEKRKKGKLNEAQW